MRRLQACAWTAILPVALVASVASAMSSGNHESPQLVIDDGGGPATSGNYRTRISIGKAVVGLATSTNYLNNLGYLVPLDGGAGGAPTVEATVPTDGAQDVEPTTVIAVAFSEPMDQGSAEGAFSMTPGVTGSFSWTGDAMTFSPDTRLAAETTYAVTVGTGATDAGGTALAAAHSLSFTVRAKSRGLYGGGCSGPAEPSNAAGGALAYAVLALLALRRAAVRRGKRRSMPEIGSGDPGASGG